MAFINVDELQEQGDGTQPVSVSQYLVSRNFRVTENGSPSMETKHLVHFSSQISRSEVCSIASRRGAPYTAKSLFNWMTSHTWPSLNHRRPRVWGGGQKRLPSSPSALKGLPRVTMRQDETKRQGAEVGQPTTKPDKTSNFSCRPSDFSCAQPLNDRPRTGPANEPPAPSPRAPLPNRAWRSWHRPTREGPPPSPPCLIPNSSF